MELAQVGYVFIASQETSGLVRNWPMRLNCLAPLIKLKLEPAARWNLLAWDVLTKRGLSAFLVLGVRDWE